MAEAIGLVVLLPLVGFLAIALLGRSLSERGAAWVACGAVGLAFVAALVALPVAGDNAGKSLFNYTWIQAGDWRISFGLTADPLSVFMSLIVTGVGLLVHIYSIGYMADELGKNFRRFFAYLNLFVFAMLLLVTSDNFLFLLVGWAGVGLSSYLLIGFYTEKDSAVAASRKALVTNTIGDVGLMLAIFVIILNTASVRYVDVFTNPALLQGGWRDGAAMLLLIAAVAKSAQLPLHTWLPDAMEGPTPVSALIHAATMVTAGVYLLARAHPIFGQSELALTVVPIVGAASALYAATCAFSQTDLKRVLAYSTMSQLGYMFFAAGIGAYEAALFHLLTHAFFKALLFLSAGAVIHALDGEQDMRNMGGLKKQMPLAHYTFLIGALAISGIPIFAGFFSKEAILGEFPLFGASATLTNPGTPTWLLPIVGWVGVIVAVMTAFYMFRAFLLTFYGPGTDKHAHSNPLSMNLPLYVLGALTTVGGFLVVPGAYNLLEGFFKPLETRYELEGVKPVWIVTNTSNPNLTNLIIGVAAGLIGIAIAYAVYGRRAEKLAVQPVTGLAAFFLYGWYLDKIYNVAIAGPVRWLAYQLTRQGDKDVAEALDWGFGGSIWQSSRGLRKTTTGYARNYALGILIGAVALLVYVAIVGLQR